MTDESIYKIKTETLGQARFDSNLASGVFPRSHNVLLHLPEDFARDAGDHSDCVFEAAGPHERLFFDPKQTRSAIVTCGGLCPGLNDVIRSIVHESHYAYGADDILGFRFGLAGFIEEKGFTPVVLRSCDIGNIHHFGGTILGTSRGAQPIGRVVDRLEKEHIDILYVIGGDGSMKAAIAIKNEIAKRGLRIAVIGIPKTIDNDINYVPKSFGFDTAVEKATEAIDCAHAEATGCNNTIGLVKLMGRESGFIAAQAALSMSDVNFVLVPELPFELEGKEGLLEAVFKRITSRGHAVIVAAEGSGQHLLQGTGKYDPSGNIVLSDIGLYLKERLSAYFAEKGVDLTIKYIDPSYIIRSVHANTSDSAYCGQLGQHAVHAAMAGRTGVVVSKIMDEFVLVPLELVTARRRKMDPKSELWRTVLESTGQWAVKGMRVE